MRWLSDSRRTGVRHQRRPGGLADRRRITGCHNAGRGIRHHGRLYSVLDDAGQPDLLRTTPDGEIDPTYRTGGIVSMTLPDGRTLSQNSHAAAPNATLATLVVSPSGETFVGVNTKTNTSPLRWQAVLFTSTHTAIPTRARPGPQRVPDVRPVRRLGVDQRPAHQQAWALPAGPHLLGRHALSAPAPEDPGIGRAGRPLGHHAAVPSATYVAALARGPNDVMYAAGWPTKGRTNAPAARSQVTAYVD